MASRLLHTNEPHGRTKRLAEADLRRVDVAGELGETATERDRRMPESRAVEVDAQTGRSRCLH